MAGRDNPSSVALVVLRLAVGLLVLGYAWSAVADAQPDGYAIERPVRAALAGASGLAAWWAESVLLHNPDALAFLWRWGALVFGLAFLLGAFTRAVGCLAAIGLLHAWVYGPAEHARLFTLLAACALVCAFGRAGHRFGLDPTLEQHAPRWLTWRNKPRRSFLD